MRDLAEQLTGAAASYEPDTDLRMAGLSEETAHARSIVLMKFLSRVAKKLRVDRHVYVVGGAVRDVVLDRPIKDIDVVIDPVALKGKDSAWFAKKLAREIPGRTSLVTNQYGVAILTVKGPWELDGHDMAGEVIEIANSRAESYGGAAGRGYKPTVVNPTGIKQDIYRREFTFNTLLLRMADLAKGPDRRDILDITGCGLRDLEKGEIRCPSDPDKTFSDDPTRMLRAIKFMNRYGFKVAPDVAASIQRNATKLRNVPYEAVATLLVNTILTEKKYKTALKTMDDLGLLDVLAGMIRDDAQFRNSMERWVGNRKVSFMFDLMDVGLSSGTRLNFLTKSQQAGLRALALGMPEGMPERLVDVLRQPGRVMDTQALVKQFGLTGKQIAKLTDIARELLLDDPDLMDDGEKLTARVAEVYQRRAVR